MARQNREIASKDPRFLAGSGWLGRQATVEVEVRKRRGVVALLKMGWRWG